MSLLELAYVATATPFSAWLYYILIARDAFRDGGKS